MNKVTLSVIALAGVSVPAQVQAATAEEIAAAKEAARAEVQKLINAATNTVEGYHAEVQKTYDDAISSLQAELNNMVEDAETETIDVAYFSGKIGTILKDAKEAEKPYDAYDELKPLYDILLDEYNSAIIETGNYEKIGPIVKANLESLEVEALGERIEGYDLTKQDICDDMSELKTEIETKRSQIVKYMDDIADRDKNGLDEDVLLAYIEEAKATYNNKVQEAIALLPSDGVYSDWQAEAVGKLNEEYRKILAAEETVNASELTSDEIVAQDKIVDDALAAIENLLSTYNTDKLKQDSIKTVWDGNLKVLSDSISAVKDDIDRCGLTDKYGETADGIVAKIEELEAQVEEAYKNHAFDEIDNGPVGAIGGEISKLGEEIAAAVANYDAYEANNKAIEEIQNKFDDAVKNAGTASDDNKYKASDYLTTEGIQTPINDLKSTAVPPA